MRAPGLSSQWSAPPRVMQAAQPCADGATKVCRNYIVSDDDVVDCFSGVRRCSDREWGPCESVADAEKAEARSCALTDPGITEAVGDGALNVRLASSSGRTSITLISGDTVLASLDVKVAANGEFHVSGNTSFAMAYRGASVVANSVRVDGRIATSCDAFDAIAVTVAAKTRNVVLTGATDSD